MLIKKIGIIILSAFCLLGCQQKKSAEKMETSKIYKVAEKMEFEIIKSEITKQISPSNKNKTYKYLKPDDEDNVFVDLVIKTTNLSNQEMKLADIFSGHYKINKQTYDIKVAIETINYNQITTTDTLKANEGRYIHLYCEVAEDQIKDDATIELRALDQDEYTYTFTTEQKIENNDTKSLGDVLTFKKSQITLNHISQSSKIEPSNKGFFYSYYPTENDDEIFVILQVDFKNTGDTQLDPGDYLYCEYHVGEEKIKSMIVLESENHKSLSKSGYIEPSQTRTLYLAMAVKNNLLKQEGTIQLFVEGQIFEINNYKV